MISNADIYEAGVGKRPFAFDKDYQVFISAFNLSSRVRDTFGRISSDRKFWLIHNEYRFSPNELPPNEGLITSSSQIESDFIIEALDQLPLELTDCQHICVDITGFMRPHLLFLMRYLAETGVRRVDFIYTEPSQYSRKAETAFSSDIVEVRQINGFEGVHSTDMSKDVLIVGVGYDHDSVSHVIANKSGAKLVQLISLPSLSADMYQESLIRLHKVADAPPRTPEEQVAYSSANDPFITYLALEEVVKKIRNRQTTISNLYLSPLATKPQVVGFAMYYLKKLNGTPSSVIFPFARSYSKKTGSGIGRSWIYELEL